MESESKSSNDVPAKANGDSATAIQASLRRYWSSNVKILTCLLTLWALLGLGCGILFADALNVVQFLGYPLGFWFAQQGSIIGFVLIILCYCVLMNRLDSRHHKELETLRAAAVKESASGGAGE